MKNRPFVLAASCAVLLTCVAGAQDTFTWDGGGADGNWSSGANWLSDTAPNGNDVLNFAGTTNTATTNNLVNIGGVATGYGGYRIFFNSGAGEFTLAGNPVTLFDFGGAAPKLENNSTSLQTVSLALTLNGTNGGGFGEINPVNGDLTFSSTGTVTLSGTTQLRIFGDNGKTVTFNGVISGANSVAINQNSNVVYGAANTYTGDTFINAGSLSFAQGGSLSVGTLQLGDTNSTGASASLRISDADGGTTIARPIVVRAGSSGVKTIASTNTTGTNTFSSAVTLNDNVTFSPAAGGGLTVSGVISGDKSVTKTGDGLLTLSGANTFSGGLILNGGNTRLTVANTISGDITLNAGGTLEANTAGANNTAYDALFGAAGNSFVFNGGTFLANAASAANVDRTLTGRNVTVNAGGATFNIVGNYTNYVEGIFNQLRFNSTSNLSGSGTLTKNGGGRLQFQNGSAFGFSGPVVINDGTVEAAGSALGDSSATNTITINGGNFAVSGTTSQAITMNGGAISANGATRNLDGNVNVAASSYFFLNDFWRDFDSAGASNNIGRTIVVNGVLSGSANIGVAVNRAGYQFNNGSLTLRNISNSYSGTITVGKNLRLESNSSSGTGNTLGTATIQLADGGLNLRDDGSAGGATGEVFNYGNDISVIAPTDLLNRGTIAGAAFIDVNRSSGTTAANNTFRLGSLSLGERSLKVTGGNGYRLEFGEATTFGNQGTIDTTIDVTLAGGISSGVNLVKSGTGRLFIDAPSGSSYSGTATVNAGMLVFNTPNAIGGTGASVKVGNNAGVGAGYAIDQAFLNRIEQTDNSIVIGLGVNGQNIDLSAFGNARLGAVADVNYTGAILQKATNPNYLLGGGGGTLTLVTPNALTGTRGLDVGSYGAGAGTVVLAAANNLSGPLTVKEGMTLRPSGIASLGSGTGITLDNGTLQLATGGDFTGLGSRTFTAGAGGATLDTGGHNITVSTVVGGTGSLTKTGEGTLTLTADNSYTGRTIIRGGTLAITAENQLGDVASAANNIEFFNGATLLVNDTLAIPQARGITLSAGGGIFHVADAKTLTVDAAIVGSGAFVKDGKGTMSITRDPNNNGGFTVNSGVLELNHGGSTDGSIVVNDGATLRTFQAVLGDGHNVTLNGSGAVWDLRSSDQILRLLGDGRVTRGVAGTSTITINSTVSEAFNGIIENGSGTLALTKGGSNTVTFTNKHTYSGATAINTGTLAIEGPNGALGNTAITVGDNSGGDETLTFGAQNIDTWSKGELDRLGNSGSITLNGRGRVNYNGPGAGSSGFEEKFGALTVSSGANLFTLNPGIEASVQVSPATLARVNNATLLVRGDNLGGNSVGSTRLVPTTAPTLTGANGGEGSNLMSILPWAVGDTSSFGAGTSFVTNGPSGLRILSNSEYDSSIAGSVLGRNVSTAGGETINGQASINALRITGGTTTLAAGSKLSVGSGALLFTNAAELGGSGTLDFGSNEGIIHLAQNDVPTTAVVSANIIGGNGLTISALSSDNGNSFLQHTVVLSGENKFVGNLTVNHGTLRFGSSNAVNQLSHNTLVMRPGSALQLGGNNIVVKDIQGSNSGYSIQNAADTNGTLTVFSTTNTTVKGAVTDGGGTGSLSLVKRGAGTLTLDTGVSNFSGTLNIDRGGLVLSGGGGDLTSNGTDGTASIRVSGGGFLRIDNGTNNGDRLRNNASIALNAATFDFTHGGNSGTNYGETAGALTLEGGFNSINVRQAAADNTSVLTLASLNRNAGSQAQINFGSNVAGALGVDGRSRLVFTTAPTLNNGLIGGWAFINGTDFATYSSTGTVSVQALTTTADAETAWDTTKNVKPAASVTLTGDRIVNSLTVASGSSLDLGAKILNIDTGGLIHQTSVATDTISNGTLTAGATAGADLVIRTSNGAGSLTVSAVIADNSAGGVGLIKTGPGRLVLSGNNTYTGPTFVGGTLAIGSDNALGTAPASFKADHLKISDGGTLEVTANTELNANRGIQLSGAIPTIRTATGATLTYNGSISIAGGGGNSDLTLLGNVAFGGNANSIPGGLNVGVHLVGSIPVGTSTVTVAPTSRVLSVGAAAQNMADLNVAYRTVAPTTDSGSTVATLNLQGLDTFNADLANLRIGVIGSSGGGSATAKGELLLPAVSNIKAGSGVLIGDSQQAGNASVTSALKFGNGVSTLTTTSVVVGGRKGNGLLSVANGGTLVLNGFSPNTADLLVAYNNINDTGVTASGSADFSSSTLVADFDELVVGFKNGSGGNSGGATGTLTLGPSAHQIVTNQIRLGDYSGGTSGTVAGTLNLGGGTTIVNGDVTLASYVPTGTVGAATGTLNITGGTLTVGGNIVTSNNAKATANLTLNGGTLDMTNGSINVDSFTVQSGTLKNVSQIFSGDGATSAALTKTGSGMLAIEGANTYVGDTLVNAGSVVVNGSISGNVSVSSTAALGGDGTIGGNVTVAGGATLGNLGSLDVGGSLTLGSNSTLSLDLGGLNPGGGSGLYDQVNAVGVVSIESNVTLSLSLGFAPNTTVDTFYFILNRGAGSSGTFANLPEGARIDLGNGFVGTITYQANWTGDQATSGFSGGNDVAIMVPEPSTIVTLFGGLGALVGLGRFRRRRF